MKILLGICTFNRAESLRITLDRIRAIAKPVHSEFTMVVVNNNSNDNTVDVVQAFMSLLPISLVHEAKVGVSHARSAVVQHAISTGADYILFTDDDTLPCEDWLCLYEDAFLRHPESSVFGGSIEPWFESKPPQWLQKAWPVLRSAYGVHDDGNIEEPLRHTGSKTPFGANYAIRTREHAQSRYDATLGIRGKIRVGGEETAMIRNIIANGATGWWVPGATVQHFIPKDKMGFSFLAKYYRGQGRSMNLMGGVQTGSLWSRRWAIRATIENLMQFAFYFAQQRPELAMQHYRDAFIAFGQFE